MIVGKSSEDKIKSLREEMEKKRAAGVVISALDEVAWLFNLRGSDIDFNQGKFLTRRISPWGYTLIKTNVSTKYFYIVFFAYAFVTADTTVLFVDNNQIDDEVRSHLGASVETKPYESIFEHLKTVSGSLGLSKEKVLSDCQNPL